MATTDRPKVNVPVKGLLKGMALTLKTLFTRPVTINYPVEKETPVPRARGVIALDPEACTVCMLCARECPDWCIYIEGHKEEVPPAKEGGRVRTRATLDRFDIDYALCMYWASALRCVRSMPSSGAPITNTPSTRSARCCTTRAD